MPVDEQIKCRCGKPMLTTPGGGKYCENCDIPQPQEHIGIGRQKTREDVRFEMYWKREEELMEDKRTEEAKRKDPTPTIYNAPGESDTEGGT